MVRLRTRILLMFLPVIILMGVSVAYYGYSQAAKVERQKTEEAITQLSKLIADEIKLNVDSIITTTKTASKSSVVKSGLWALMEGYLKDLANQKEEVVFYFYANKKGEYWTTLKGKIKGKTLASREYFKKALSTGKVVVSKPVISKSTGKPIVVVAAPVEIAKGVYNGIVAAVISLEKLSEKLVKHVKLGKTGYGMLTTFDGTLIAYPDPKLVLKTKVQDQAKEFIKALKDAQQGKSGIISYEFKGRKKYAAYTPIKELKWIVFVTVWADEVITGAPKIAKNMIIITLIGILLAFVVSMFCANSLIKIFEEKRKALAARAQGDLTVSLSPVGIKEIDDMIVAFNQTGKSMSDLIEKVKGIAFEITGALEDISAAVEESNASMEEIAANVDGLAKTADSNSKMAEEVNANIEKVAQESQKVADVVRKVGEQSDTVKEEAKSGQLAVEETSRSVRVVKDYAEGVAKVINEMVGVSQKISDIVGTITAIADQTNLLALNAAIEAARAGEAGRGFAVVAEEVRKLAEESAQAADEIGQLAREIQGRAEESMEKMKDSQKAVEDAANKAEQTRERVTKVIEAMENVAADISEVVGLIESQTESINNMANAMAQLADNIAEENERIQGINASVEEQTAAVDNIAMRVQNLAEAARKLEESVKMFKTKKESKESGIVPA